jgi:hypothetical protein
LQVVLVVSGLATLPAFLAALMPFAWMKAVHEFVGLGELPDRPIVHYLTRSLSMLYAYHAVLALVLASNVRRFGPIITVLAWATLFFGVFMLELDLLVGMPWFWTLAEGPPVMLIGGLLLWFRARCRREEVSHAG